MDDNKRQQKLNDRIAPIVEAMGYEFVGCECLSQGHYSTLRIYIDKEGGVTVDDCGEVSHQLSVVLEAGDPIATKYTLEVSSLGIDRPLFTLEHFRRFIGERVSVHLYVPINKQRNFKGSIVDVVGDQILLNIEGEEIKLPFKAITKAKLCEEHNSKRMKNE